MLCDAASIRDSLLNVLGGGITNIGVPSFPTAIGCDLALSLYLTPERVGTVTHAILVRGKAEGSDETLFEIETGLKVEITGDERDIRSQSASMILPVGMMGVQEPGGYTLEVLVDSEELAVVPFTVELVASI